MLLFYIIIYIVYMQLAWLIFTKLYDSDHYSTYKYYNIYYDDIKTPFIHYFKSHNIDISPIVNKLYRNKYIWAKLILLKFINMRLRPCDIICNFKLLSFSWPSGHFYIASYISSQLSIMYPSHKDALNNIAKNIGNYRIKQNFHWKTDLVYL